MNTFNNMAQAAAKAVWGENDKKQEPVAGQLGDVSKGEPYDAGNIEPQQTEQKPESKIEEQPEPKVEEHPESKIEETKQEPETGTEVNPAETKESSIVPGDSTKAQNDTRDPSNPQTDPEAAKAKENVNDASTGLDTDDDPVKVEGPGPKPVQELAKENGGDAGNRSSTDSQKSAGEDSAVSGVDDEEEDGPQKTSHGTGTGEIYIKSTGLKADGGDFDAARAGAGREADRLLEEKGIKSTSSPKSGSSDTLESKPSSTGKEKVSLKDKIKSKLHKTPVS